MEKTSVEWLIEKLKNVEYNPLQKNGYSIAEEILYNQAKEMHNKEIIDAWNNGLSNWDNTGDCNAKQYYIETFKK